MSGLDIENTDNFALTTANNSQNTSAATDQSKKPKTSCCRSIINKMSSRQDIDLSFCVVWSPLWPITLLLPFIGHLGITTSHGTINDFAGSYFVGTDGQMAFGPPTRYLKIDIGSLPGGAERWDAAIEEANHTYSHRVHNICCDNCHSHVALALNRMPLETFGIRKWDMVKLCFLVFFRARFVSFGGFLCQFLPFFAVLLFIIVSIAK